MHWKTFELGSENRPVTQDKRWYTFTLGEDHKSKLTQWTVARLGLGKIISNYFNPWMKK